MVRCRALPFAFPAEPVTAALAAIVVILPGLGRFHRGAGLLVTACPEIGGLAARLTSSGPPDGSALLGRHRRSPGRLGGTPGLPSGRSPGGGGRWPPYPPERCQVAGGSSPESAAVNPIFPCPRRQPAA